MITAIIREAIKTHAENCYPLECCGLLIELKDGINYWPCRNQSSQLNQFELHPEDYADAEDLGKIIAIVHSHINQTAEPSPADIDGCNKSSLPWIIYAHPSGDLQTIKPTGKRYGLLQRPYIWGVYDCATLVEDYYREKLNNTLPPYERYPDNFWKQGFCLLEKYQELGFIEVPHEEPIQPHDILLIQIRSELANHAAIYVGDGLILHHLENRLSERVLYSEFWQKQTLYVMRYN